MRREIKICLVVLLVLDVHFLVAQQVLYSPVQNDRWVIQTEVAGKVGEYYWTRVVKKRRVVRGQDGQRLHEEQSFDIYDARMRYVTTAPSLIDPDTVIKQYLIPGSTFFDQLVLLQGYKKTDLLLERYESNGNAVHESRIIGSFPFNEPADSWLLVRSEDKTKILLLGFESIPSSSPRMHAVVFDQDWRMLSDRTYEHPSLTQPILQDDATSYPIDDFSKSPVKLANNGQWLMAAPSREDHSFLLFHFCGEDNSYAFKKISLATSSAMEDVALSIDNEKGEASAGILSRLHYYVHKNVRTVHYSMGRREFDFDSSYRFSTLLPGKLRNENLEKENFIAVPGDGFILLKEYGRSFAGWHDEEAPDNPWDPEAFFFDEATLRTGVRFPLMQDGYARYSELRGLGGAHGRGDLSLFYFPGNRKDSCWSGLISKEQVTELNAPDLSYLVVPVKNKLFFLYNSFIREGVQYGNATIIDHQGNLMSGEGVIFWQFSNTLLFQQSRQISSDEVAVPYEKNQRRGFAIIRF
ncbi:MAG TPA: hypothetical protein VK563_09125 [Puia sp.]|nr:hypothetical protein [Puia sp.]